MHNIIQSILTQQNILAHQNQGITIAKVDDANAGFALARDMLYELVDTKTVLYLSGGSLKSLYELLTKEEVITPGAVGLVDERYGPKFHETSNEKMIRETQFLRYLQARDIPFYPILQNSTREETAEAYDTKFRELNARFPKSVGLLGIGPDGHTSSIIPNRPDFHNPWFDSARQNAMISEFNDPKSHYKERVGMTFLALSMLDFLIVPAFGSAKQEMFAKIFEEGSEEEIPARYFKRAEIAEKTIFITDQSL